MRNLAVVFTTLVISASVMAGEFFAELRTDYDSRTSNDDKVKAGTPNNSRLYMQTARIDAKGKLSELTTYRLRYAFNKGLNASGTNYGVYARDNAGVGLEYAYMTHKLSDVLATTFGKFLSMGSGWYGLVTGSDRYVTPRYASTYWAAVSGPYMTGLEMLGNFGDSSVRLQASTDVTDTSLSSAAYAGTRNGVGLVLNTAVMEKTLSFVLSHHMWNLGEVTADKKTSLGLTTLGVKWTQGGMGVSADINSAAYKNTSATNEFDMTGIFVNYWHEMDNLKPIVLLSMENETKKDLTAAALDVKTAFTKIGLALEYKPEVDQNYRYHIAVTQETEKADTDGAVSLTENHVVVGAKIYADIMK